MTYLSPLLGFLGIAKKINSINSVCVVPFGLEKSVSYGSGTKNGPKAILKASHQVELFDEELLQDSYQNFQINTLKPFKVKKKLTDALNQLSKIIKNILDKKEFPLILGGEHSITPGIIKAFSQKYKKLFCK